MSNSKSASKFCSLIAVVIAASWLTSCNSPSAPPPAAPSSVEPVWGVPPREDSANYDFEKVTHTFGPLVVQEGFVEIESPIRPWSGWWLPTTDDYLFKDKDSPLGKYDAYVKAAHTTDPQSANWEKTSTLTYNPTGARWGGRCHAWSPASVLEAEPTHEIVRNGVKFSVGDQKALLVKSYEDMSGAQYFGQRYNGEWDSVFGDIYPDQIHRLLQVQLIEQKKPFIIDQDPGIEVWNYPVYGFQSELKLDPTDSHVMHVKTWLKIASPDVPSFDYVGTLRAPDFTYTYDLIGSLEDKKNFHVVIGKWTGDSRKWHPDFAWVLPDHAEHHSWNPKVQNAMIDEILGRVSHPQH